MTKQTKSAQLLLVEDDPPTRQLLIEILEPAGYSMVSAPDGETALHLLADSVTNGSPFSVVVTDIYMRTVSGIEVLEAARHQPQPPGVILLTGSKSVETAVAALRGGAYDYVLKPVAPESLRTSVAAAIERHRAEQRPATTLETLAQGLHQLHDLVVSTAAGVTDSTEPAATTVDNQLLAFDTERHTVRWRGQPLHVTPIEYRLLRYLAETPNQVRSYQEIVQRTHTLDTNSYEAKHLLKSHVRNLRRKIDSGVLVNVSGTGYMLEVAR